MIDRTKAPARVEPAVPKDDFPKARRGANILTFFIDRKNGGIGMEVTTEFFSRQVAGMNAVADIRDLVDALEARIKEGRP